MFWILKKTLHAAHILKLFDKMCKYEMDTVSIVEDTEWTRFCPQTNGQMDRRTDKVKPVYPLSTSLSVGYKYKNTLETCKNPRPTSGWSELTKSCATSTMNFHMAYFSWIPQNIARLKLSCKFGESKCNPYWYITLTTSHGMNYVVNEHLDVSQHDPYAIPSVMILWYS